MRALLLNLQPLCAALAMIGVALAGIFDQIDESTMITLFVVLSITGWRVNGCRPCFAMRGGAER